MQKRQLPNEFRDSVQNTICNQRTANQAGISPSTVYSILNTKSQNPGVVTLQKLCDGIGITLREFFDDDLFEHIEPEVQ